MVLIGVILLILAVLGTTVQTAATGEVSLIVSYTSDLQFTHRKTHSIEIETAMIANILLHPYLHLYVIYDSESEKKCAHFVHHMSTLATGVTPGGNKTGVAWSKDSENRLHCIDKEGGQPNYVDMLRYVSTLPTISETVMLANADVVLGENLKSALNVSTGVVLAFSVTGFAPKASLVANLYDQLVSNAIKGIVGRNRTVLRGTWIRAQCRDTNRANLPMGTVNSFDALLFRRPVHYISDEDAQMFLVHGSDGVPYRVYMNNFGAEGVVLKAMIYLGICASGTVWNMCEEVPLYHLHLSPKTHHSNDTIKPVPLKMPLSVHHTRKRSPSLVGRTFTDYPSREDALTGSPRQKSG